jgi:hypothetical protein
MKTTKNMKTLRRLTATASAVVIFGAALMAMPNAENNPAFDAASARLDNLAIFTEQIIQYEAPDATLTDAILMERDAEIGTALDNLESLAIATENDIRYVAFNEVDTRIAYEQLDQLTSDIVADLVYLAPEAEVTGTVETPELMVLNF